MSIFSDYEAQRERAYQNEQDDREQAGIFEEMVLAVAEWLGAEVYEDDLPHTIKSCERRIYKDTSCGAWIDFPGCGTIRTIIGTIVEGSDVEPCVWPEELVWPFTQEELEHAIEEIEAEADAKWHEINGGDDAPEVP